MFYCKVAEFFQNTFPKNTSGRLLLVIQMRRYIVNQLIEHQRRTSTRSWIGLLNQPLLSCESFSRPSPAIFWMKRKHKYKEILTNFFQKSKFPQSQKSTKKYRSSFLLYTLSTYLKISREDL